MQLIALSTLKGIKYMLTSLDAMFEVDLEDRVRTEVEEVVRKAESMRKVSVLTTGCFDLFHYGHLKLLEYCATLGDVTVGINCDKTIGQLKPGRPIVPLEERVAILEAISFVGEVIVFDEPTPALLIRKLKPEIFVKGQDYSVKMLPEECQELLEYGGMLRIFRGGVYQSTSLIVDKCRGL